MKVNKDKEDLLSYEDAHELFYQDKETGTLHWKVSPAIRVKPGDVAGHVDSVGYRIVEVNNRAYACHRVVWLMHYGSWPKQFVDHINRDKADNRIENLRDVSNTINCRNHALRKVNKSGHTGVHWHKALSKWTAQINVGKTKKHLGVYEDLEDAVKARKDAEEKYWGAA